MDTTLRTRYGIATIQVTAVKHRMGPTSRVIDEQTVRAVLNEIPFPVPVGAIEAAGAIDENGNFGTHWAGTNTSTHRARCVFHPLHPRAGMVAERLASSY